MRLFRKKKPRWQRALEPGNLAKSGLKIAAGAVALTTASAVVSALRHRDES